jgi:hypothetical protein
MRIYIKNAVLRKNQSWLAGGRNWKDKIKTSNNSLLITILVITWVSWLRDLGFFAVFEALVGFNRSR